MQRKKDSMKKKLALILSAALMFGLTYIPAASADGMTSEESNIAMNVAYAEQILYCNSDVQFSKYKNGEIFDNDGGCIDPSPLFADGADGWAQLALKYQGGLHRWVINADNGKTCWFFIYHGDPNPDPQILVWDTFFTACSVKLNQPVSENWVMFDFEFPNTSPVFEKCADTVAPFTGYENNCLQFGTYTNPVSGDVISGTGTVINKAANTLKKKFYAPFKGWLRYNGYANQLTAYIAKSPAATKIYIQKWVDYKWVTVRSGERYWGPKSTVMYAHASSGKYRFVMKSITGLRFVSKVVVVKVPTAP